MTLAAVRFKVVVLLLLIRLLLVVSSIVAFCNCSMFCCTLLCVHSSLQSSWWGRESRLLCFVCLPGFSWFVCFFLTMPWVCPEFVIVVFPWSYSLTNLVFNNKIFFSRKWHQIEWDWRNYPSQQNISMWPMPGHTSLLVQWVFTAKSFCFFLKISKFALPVQNWASQYLMMFEILTIQIIILNKK